MQAWGTISRLSLSQESVKGDASIWQSRKIQWVDPTNSTDSQAKKSQINLEKKDMKLPKDDKKGRRRSTSIPAGSRGGIKAP